MSKSELSRMTVKELRELCGRHGLPKYQRAGKRLVKADLVAQLADSSESTYRVAPVSELVSVSNGARKWRETDHGDRILSAGYVEYKVLRIIGTEQDPTEVRYADPADPGRSWRSKYRARDAVARRELTESQARTSAPTKQPRKRWKAPSQRMLDSRWAGGRVITAAVGV